VKYKRTYSGETFQVARPWWRVACCDCGLVHDMKFKVSGHKIFLTVERNNRATAAKRRRKQKLNRP
jgi:hypothetical protein